MREQIELNQVFAEVWENKDPFREVDNLYGEVVRQMNGRRTLRFELAGHGYYLKSHKGVGWKEIFKNILQLKRPALGARDEYEAIRKLESLKIDTMTVAAFGERGNNPAKRESFLITEELCNTQSLEDFCMNWPQNPPTFQRKLALTRRLAWTVGTMHENGINHRDCYLCHFLLDLSTTDIAVPQLFVIDLHRAQIRTEVPRHYLLKDLGGLWFSAMDIGLTRRDLFRFLKSYTGQTLHELMEKRTLWQQVDKVARLLYRKDHGREPAYPKLFD